MYLPIRSPGCGAYLTGRLDFITMSTETPASPSPRRWLRILEQESAVQDQALQAARHLLTITTNQYQAGIVGYLNVIVAQATALNTERNSIDVLGRRMEASVKLVKGIGGGWNAGDLAAIDGNGQHEY